MIRIPLRARDGSVRDHALIDDADVAVSELRWCRHSAGYAYRMENRKAIFLHRRLMAIEDAGFYVQVDHINGDRLDCRRSNMRVVTLQENRQNTVRSSKPRGVFLDKRRGRWYGQVQVDGRTYSTGYCATQEEAATLVSGLRARLMPASVPGR